MFASRTHIGTPRSSRTDAVHADVHTGLAIVADGLGSDIAGETASGLAVELIRAFVHEGLQGAVRPGSMIAGGSTHGSLLLRDALVHTNQMIHYRAERQGLYSGMGATVVAALFYTGRVAIAHVGDARAYRLRGSVFEQLTRDRVLPCDGPGPEPAPAKRATHALGVRLTIMVDLMDDQLDADDIYLFCSNALYSVVTDADLGLTLRIFSDNLETAAKQLIKLANDNGGRDNISVIMARAGALPGDWRRDLWQRVSGWFS
ncbi:MAG: PP2C family protein-serine/threonine phosphatase [Gammaproteobacteria bacterium]